MVDILAVNNAPVVPPVVQNLTKEHEDWDGTQESLQTYLLHSLEKQIEMLEKLGIFNMAEEIYLRQNIQRQIDDIYKEGTGSGTLKIVFGILTALPGLAAGINTQKIFGYEPDKLQKMSEGIMLMIRNFGEAANTFVDNNRQVIQTEQRLDMDAWGRMAEKLRNGTEQERAAGEAMVRILDTYHSGTRAGA